MEPLEAALATLVYATVTRLSIFSREYLVPSDRLLLKEQLASYDVIDTRVPIEIRLVAELPCEITHNMDVQVYSVSEPGISSSTALTESSLAKK